MKFQDISVNDKLKLNVFLIDVEHVGAWFLKIRKNGVVVNHRDLISFIQVDATIVFKTASCFFRIMDGGSTISDEVLKANLTFNGSADALKSFCNKLLRICDLPCSTNVVARPPVRLQFTEKPNTKVLPLKAGWLLKKRDIFSGWRCRYFIVYPDRLDYFVDQFDATPKATLSLVDVEVQPVKRVNMPGTGEHWGFKLVYILLIFFVANFLFTETISQRNHKKSEDHFPIIIRIDWGGRTAGMRIVGKGVYYCAEQL